MNATGDTIGTDCTPADAQGEVIDFLAHGAGLGPAARRIDTHGAIVFLTGPHALKMKRAVTYDYMDLSTLDRRHALLEREFALNRRAAPSIYRGIRPVVRRPDGQLALGGAGEVLEWVLVMNRFPAESELIRIARRGGLDDDLAGRLGTAIARYHAAAPVRQIDGAALIGEILDELDRVLGPMTPTLGPDVAAVLGQAREAWRTLRPDLSARTAQGEIRRCHGDLHLRNLVMIGDTPTPFDALEFDERLGTCDTLYDLAFLLMDLDHLALRRAANGTLNAYLFQTTPDLSEAGLNLLPLYLAVRAAIRAMVDVQGAAIGVGDDPLADARAYLEQARDYLVPRPPHLLAIGGFSGSGKTTLARALAHRVGAAPGAVHLRSDVTRKTLLHRDPLQRLGSEGYTPRMSARTYDRIREQARAVLSQGHSVILDAVHGDTADRAATEAVARELGCAFTGIWLDAPTETRLERVADRMPDASDADADVVLAQAGTDPGPVTWHRIDNGRDIDGTVATILSRLPEGDAPDRSAARRTFGGKHVG